MIKWDEIKQEYETTKITLAKLAEKHGIPLGTIKSQKSRDTKSGNPWARDGTKKDATKSEKVATKNEPKKQMPKDVEIVVQAFEKDTEENVGLSEGQRFFCLYYVKYLNATKAYQKAYESTYETANSNAYRLMVDDGIRAEISRLKKARVTGIMLDQNDVLQKYIDIAFADIGDYVEYGTEDIEERDSEGEIILDADGYPKTYKRSYVHLKDGDSVDNTIVSEVKLGKDGMSVKLHDKMKALDVLAKYTDLLNERQLKQLQVEKLKAETEFAQLRAGKLRGDKKDTSLLDALVEGRKQYEQMKQGEPNGEA